MQKFYDLVFWYYVTSLKFGWDSSFKIKMNQVIKFNITIIILLMLITHELNCELFILIHSYFYNTKRVLSMNQIQTRLRKLVNKFNWIWVWVIQLYLNLSSSLKIDMQLSLNET